MPHYAKCDVISRENKQFKLKYVINKTLQRKNRKNLYYIFKYSLTSYNNNFRLIDTFKPIFHLATLFARREAKTRIRQRDWLKLAGEKIRGEQVGSVPLFLSVRANKVAKSKTGLSV